MARKIKYLELVSKLEKKICKLSIGSLLPSEQSLSEELEVSKPTLRKALSEMVENGYLKKENGIGTTVIARQRNIKREIVFLCHDLLFFAETANSLCAYSTKRNYFTSVVPLRGSKTEQELIVSSLIERKPSGVVIYADTYNCNLKGFQTLLEENIPTVYLMRLPEKTQNNLVRFDNNGDIPKIIQTFYDHGCRKIALYGDKNAHPIASAERTEGYIKGMTRCRLKPKKELICINNSTTELNEFLKIFTSTNAPDAVCCINDDCAAHLIEELINRNVDLNTIRFSGFDNKPLSKFIPAEILTVEPPMTKMGKYAAEMLIRQIENPKYAFQKKNLRTKIITTGKKSR
ncbi:MAG: LacI family DNA-binding transcriptional regulator [Kiritimatiellae bacterium]|jgi:GntR family transcriptional regulator of arabinose operon|nr:LacI family DNA-binding transcriptional regulator [Kiritimatiellia bacterium]